MSDLHADTPISSIETQNGSALGNTQNGSSFENTKNGIINNASGAADTIKNHPITQNIANGTANAANAIKNHPITQNIANGPVADNIMDQHAKTQAEFSNLAASRQTPATPAATGQPLTHYHGFFGSLLSWENPRASGIAYALIVLFIFAARYLDIIRYTFKLSYIVLFATVLAEGAGKLLFSTGLTSQIRPKKYYTVSKETLNSFIGDVHELLNFFIIEAQQIVFAENLPLSIAAFLSAFLSYHLIKIVPFWGLSLISTSVLFLAPLIYKTNQELIDHHLSKATKVINDQTVQVKTLATEHAGRAAESTKSLVGDYSAKAQGMIGSARGRSVSPTLSSKPAPVAKKENIPSSSYKAEDFPTAPRSEFNPAFPTAPKDEFKSTPAVGDLAASLKTEDEPLIV